MRIRFIMYNSGVWGVIDQEPVCYHLTRKSQIRTSVDSLYLQN